MRDPAGAAADRNDRDRRAGGELERAAERDDGEVDRRLHVDQRPHAVDERARQQRAAARRARCAQAVEQDRGARIAAGGDVQWMAESGKDLAAAEAGADDGGGAGRRGGLLEEGLDAFAGAAVQRPLEGGEAAGDDGVRRRARRGDAAGGERRGVELVIGAEDERGLEERAGLRDARRPALLQGARDRVDRGRSAGGEKIRPGNCVVMEVPSGKASKSIVLMSALSS